MRWRTPRWAGSPGRAPGEQSLARRLYRRLEEDWLLIADRNFYNWADWCTAADSGAALLWRVKSDLTLPVLELLPDGSYASVLVSPKIRGKAREALIGAARAGKDMDEDQARYVRVIEYTVPDRDGDGKDELIALVTTITEAAAAPAAGLAEAYHQRWEHAVMADITRKKNLNPRRRHRTHPRVVKRGRHNSYRVKKPGDIGIRHDGPPRSGSPTPP